MEDVIADPPRHVPLWMAAAQGNPDWGSIFTGFSSAVDWPTASFWSELSALHPDAKVVLTVRDLEKWAESFMATINKLMAGADQAPPEKQGLLKMVAAVKGKAGFPLFEKQEDAVRAFNTHVERVKAGVPAKRLLVYDVKEGWEPLCRFLGRPVPDTPFPRMNSREDFWARVTKH